MTENGGHGFSEGGEVPEDRCPTCGMTWGNHDGRYCSNSFHLATPQIMRQLAAKDEEIKKLKQEIAWLEDQYKNKAH